MPKEKGKHLTVVDRVRIEEGIKNKESFSSIARAIGVSPSTITREVKTNRHAYTSKKIKRTNLCIHKNDCTKMGLCDINCAHTLCTKCRSSRCNELCSDFEERICSTLLHAPYVCANCKKLGFCGLRRYTYRAIYAHESYEKRLISTREGISITPEQLTTMVRTVKRLLGQGQSLEAIWATHAKDFPVCVRTFYNYVDSGLFGIANIELPKKVRYKARKSTEATPTLLDKTGRTYDDYLALSKDKQRSAVQMDCVMGRQSDFKCILSLHFPRFEFQIYLLLPDHTQECVACALDWVESLCEGKFSKSFGIILTDRGHEFKNFEALEKSALRKPKRCRVYYCNPLRSNQKGSCERNHGLLRRIVPKGTSIEGFTNYDMALATSHLNSYPRPSLGGATPYKLASQALPKGLLDGLGISLIPPDEVIMNPSLIK